MSVPSDPAAKIEPVTDAAATGSRAAYPPDLTEPQREVLDALHMYAAVYASPSPLSYALVWVAINQGFGDPDPEELPGVRLAVLGHLGDLKRFGCIEFEEVTANQFSWSFREQTEIAP